MDPLLIDIPEEFETARMTIRAARPGEGAAVNEAIRESFAELKPWLTWAQELPTVEQSELQARQAHAKFHAREDLIYRGWLKGTDTFVVGSGLHRIDWAVPKFEIGYFVRTSLAGHGYVSEMVHALTAMAFEALKAERVEIRCDDTNARSCALRSGADLRWKACSGDSRSPDGGVHTRVYARIRTPETP